MKGLPFGDVSAPAGPGWQLEPFGNKGRRGMIIEGGSPLGQNPAYRPSAQINLPVFRRLRRRSARRYRGAFGVFFYSARYDVYKGASQAEPAKLASHKRNDLDQKPRSGA